jgi:hypothetical protein
MTDAIPLRQGERGVVRVFALDLPAADVAAFASPGEDWPLKQALGATVLDTSRVQVFPLSDLEGVGLRDYLIDGMGVDPATLAPDAATLDALEGYVAVLPSAAFGGTAQTLHPRPPLRLLGTYAEVDMPVTFEPLPAGGADGVVGTPSAPGASPARWLGVMAAVLTILIAAAVWLGLSGGTR